NPEKAKEKTANLAEAKLVCTTQRGFHYLIGAADPFIELRLPSMFIQVVRHHASIACTTRELINCNELDGHGISELQKRSTCLRKPLNKAVFLTN
uniref:Protein kinase domain-containing protein n=1 Tax=Parascaris univalens TaxID=6257 RepID=A0A914ZWK0_PARUN